MIKRIYKIAAGSFVGLVILLTIAIYLVYQDYLLFLATPIEAGQYPVKIQVKPGTNFGHLANDLAERQLITNKRYLTWYARSENLAQKIKAGRYAFHGAVTPEQLLAKIVAGDVEQFTLTVVEGWTFRQMISLLGKHPQIVHKLDGRSDDEIMTALNLSGQHPEGQFMPDTYHFPEATTDVQFLTRAWKAMQDYVQEQWENRSENLPLKTPYEAMVLASIVEKETGQADERPQIAGVFVRRLQKGMKLQTDPTVIYGMGENFDGNIRRKDLRTDTPYNTYTRYGLPPTPIALPGKAAIDAVLHPADGKSLYFVSKGDGSHQFSDTLEAHNRAVRKYQLGK